MTTQVKDNQLNGVFKLPVSPYIKSITAGENVFLYDDGNGDIKISFFTPYTP